MKEKTSEFMKYFILFSFVFMSSCATMKAVSVNKIKNDIAFVKRNILKDRNYMNTLKDRRIGSGGFYYIIDVNGRVIFHPLNLLIGRNYSDYWFIKKILKEKVGCLKYEMGNGEHFIFFDKLSNWEIICFSISTNGISRGSENCKQAIRPVVRKDKENE